jgi:hypothetical protein
MQMRTELREQPELRAEILAVLYGRILKHDPERPHWPERDRFIMSKGHCTPLQYAVLAEFGLAPRQDVHFLMTTGQISQGQAALYVAETTTGKFGVYTMGPRPDNAPGVAIRRHDLVLFRQPGK